MNQGMPQPGGGGMPQAMPGQQMPMPGIQQAPQMMPGMQQPGMMAPPEMQGQASDAQVFQSKAIKLIPSIQERNPYLKEQVGHLIYDYVQKIIGVDKAPKITGMLIELPVNQIKEYL